MKGGQSPSDGSQDEEERSLQVLIATLKEISSADRGNFASTQFSIAQFCLNVVEPEAGDVISPAAVAIELFSEKNLYFLLMGLLYSNEILANSCTIIEPISHLSSCLNYSLPRRKLRRGRVRSRNGSEIFRRTRLLRAQLLYRLLVCGFNVQKIFAAEVTPRIKVLTRVVSRFFPNIYDVPRLENASHFREWVQAFVLFLERDIANLVQGQPSLELNMLKARCCLHFLRCEMDLADQDVRVLPEFGSFNQAVIEFMPILYLKVKHCKAQRNYYQTLCLASILEEIRITRRLFRPRDPGLVRIKTLAAFHVGESFAQLGYIKQARAVYERSKKLISRSDAQLRESIEESEEITSKLEAKLQEYLSGENAMLSAMIRTSISGYLRFTLLSIVTGNRPMVELGMQLLKSAGDELDDSFLALFRDVSSCLMGRGSFHDKIVGLKRSLSVSVLSVGQLEQYAIPLKGSGFDQVVVNTLQRNLDFMTQGVKLYTPVKETGPRPDLFRVTSGATRRGRRGVLQPPNVSTTSFASALYSPLPVDTSFEPAPSVCSSRRSQRSTGRSHTKSVSTRSRGLASPRPAHVSASARARATSSSIPPRRARVLPTSASVWSSIRPQPSTTVSTKTTHPTAYELLSCTLYSAVVTISGAKDDVVKEVEIVRKFVVEQVEDKFKEVIRDLLNVTFSSSRQRYLFYVECFEQRTDTGFSYCKLLKGADKDTVWELTIRDDWEETPILQPVYDVFCKIIGEPLDQGLAAFMQDGEVGKKHHWYNHVFHDVIKTVSGMLRYGSPRKSVISRWFLQYLAHIPAKMVVSSLLSGEIATGELMMLVRKHQMLINDVAFSQIVQAYHPGQRNLDPVVELLLKFSKNKVYEIQNLMLRFLRYMMLASVTDFEYFFTQESLVRFLQEITFTVKVWADVCECSKDECECFEDVSTSYVLSLLEPERSEEDLLAPQRARCVFIASFFDPALEDAAYLKQMQLYHMLRGNDDIRLPSCLREEGFAAMLATKEDPWTSLLLVDLCSEVLFEQRTIIDDHIAEFEELHEGEASDLFDPNHSTLWGCSYDCSMYAPPVYRLKPAIIDGLVGSWEFACEIVPNAVSNAASFKITLTNPSQVLEEPTKLELFGKNLSELRIHFRSLPFTLEFYSRCYGLGRIENHQVPVITIQEQQLDDQSRVRLLLEALEKLPACCPDLVELFLNGDPFPQTFLQYITMQKIKAAYDIGRGSLAEGLARLELIIDAYPRILDKARWLFVQHVLQVSLFSKDDLGQLFTGAKRAFTGNRLIYAEKMLKLLEEDESEEEGESEAVMPYKFSEQLLKEFAYRILLTIPKGDPLADFYKNALLFDLMAQCRPENRLPRAIVEFDHSLIKNPHAFLTLLRFISPLIANAAQVIRGQIVELYKLRLSLSLTSPIEHSESCLSGFNSSGTWVDRDSTAKCVMFRTSPQKDESEEEGEDYDDESDEEAGEDLQDKDQHRADI